MVAKNFKHVFDISGFKLSLERLPQTLPEVEAQDQSTAGRQVSRMLQACDVFCLRDTPAQTGYLLAGIHCARCGWLRTTTSTSLACMECHLRWKDQAFETCAIQREFLYPSWQARNGLHLRLVPFQSVIRS